MELNKDAVILEAAKRQAYNDFFFFTKFILERNLMEEVPHREVCEFCTAGLNKLPALGMENFNPPVSSEVIEKLKNDGMKLLMLPRNTFKSTIVTNAYVVWLLWHNPNLRIMIDSETLGNAKMYLAGVKDMIVNNELLRKIATNDKGEYLLEPNYKVSGGFTEEQLLLKHRTRLGAKEPSVFCSGVDNARTGMHPDVIIMDDLVSERNVSTPAQLEKTKDHYRFSLSLLEIGGLLLVVGTRYHMNDLYSELCKDKTFDSMIRPAVNDKGELFFPARLTKQYLYNMKIKQGSHIFNSQYMLSPIDDSDATFKEHDIIYYENARHIREVYILVDLAISQSKSADYTAIVAVGRSMNNDYYVLEYERAKYLPNETVEAIFEMAGRYSGKLKCVGIEAINYQKALLYACKDEMKRTGRYIKFIELKPNSRNKEARIKGLQPLFEAHMIKLRMSMKEMVTELTEFPFSAHDDLIDALSYILDLTKPRILKSHEESLTYQEAKNKRTGY